jgi:hypothetical protein
MQRRGEVFIAPTAHFPADGRMVDPSTASFGCSWQDEEEELSIEDAEIVGAEAAILWGRERSTAVWIRLGHSGDTYFAAGEEDAEDDGWELPRWPPAQPPPEGWWHPPAEG